MPYRNSLLFLLALAIAILSGCYPKCKVTCTVSNAGGLKATGYTLAQLDSITVYEYPNNSAHSPANLVGTYTTTWQHMSYDTTNDTLVADIRFTSNNDIVISGSGLTTTYNITNVVLSAGTPYISDYCEYIASSCSNPAYIQSYTINGATASVGSQANAYVYLVK